MYLLDEQPAYTDQLIKRLQAIPEQFLEGLSPCGEPIEVNNCDNLFAILEQSQLYLIESGLVHVFVEERPLFYLQEGDLLGINQGFELPSRQYATEDSLRLIPYQRSAVYQHLAKSIERQEFYTFYLLGQSALLTDALAQLKQPIANPPSGFKHYAIGETLLHAGAPAEHVFIIIEGHAEAWVDGQKVGDVEKDEIVGAMAVFTEEPRSATVIASEPCTVMLVPKNQFIDLMHNNPRIAHHLIETMAHHIKRLNKEVTNLRNAASNPPAK